MHILQSTGGDFFVKKETINSDLVESGMPINEINITGNTPLTTYNYRQNYEILVSDFILIGNVIGTETKEGLGTFYLFEVDSFHLASYIPRIWNSALTLLLCGIAVITFPILSIVQLISTITKRKNRIYNETQ